MQFFRTVPPLPTRTIFARVVVPASMPYILVGLRVGLGSAWGTLVAAELVAAQEGLGYRMQNAQIYVDRPPSSPP